MKKIVFNKIKLFIAITLGLLVVGMTMFGVFGFNNSVDYNASYEVSVAVDINLGESTDIMKGVADKYFEDNGYAVVKCDETTEGLIYKFNQDVSGLDKQELTDKLETALYAEGDLYLGLEVTVQADYAKRYLNNDILFTGIAVVVALVAIFIYLLIVEKLAAALTVVCTSVISILLAFAMFAITRIPMDSTGGAVILASAVYSAVLSVVMVNRFNESIKNVGNNKVAYADIMNSVAKESLFRIICLCVVLVVASILLIALGSATLRVIGLQTLVASVVGAISAYTWCTVLMPIFKGKKKIRKQEQKTEAEASSAPVAE